jgi:hypothetical protein
MSGLRVIGLLREGDRAEARDPGSEMGRVFAVAPRVSRDVTLIRGPQGSQGGAERRHVVGEQSQREAERRRDGEGGSSIGSTSHSTEAMRRSCEST